MPNALDARRIARPASVVLHTDWQLYHQLVPFCFSLLPQAGEGLGMRGFAMEIGYLVFGAPHPNPHPNPLPPAGEGMPLVQY